MPLVSASTVKAASVVSDCSGSGDDGVGGHQPRGMLQSAKDSLSSRDSRQDVGIWNVCRNGLRCWQDKNHGPRQEITHFHLSDQYSLGFIGCSTGLQLGLLRSLEFTVGNVIFNN